VAHVIVQSRIKDSDLQTQPASASASASAALPIVGSPGSPSAAGVGGVGGSVGVKENHWFNVVTGDWVPIKAALTPWKKFPPSSYPTLHVQLYLVLPPVPLVYRVRGDTPQRLELGADFASKTKTVLLEDWALSFDHPPHPDISIPTAYLNGVIFIRALYTFARLFPAHRLRSKLHKSNSPFKLGYRILSSSDITAAASRNTSELPLSKHPCSSLWSSPFFLSFIHSFVCSCSFSHFSFLVVTMSPSKPDSPILGWSFDTTNETPLPGELQTLFG